MKNPAPKQTILWLPALFAAMAMLWLTLSPKLSHAESFQTMQSRLNSAFIGDLEQIRERRILRVLVSYNRTNFFHTNKGERGLEHDLILAYEDYLNRGPRKERYKTHVVFLSKPFNHLLDALTSGEGDIVAAGLSITPERQMLVDFTKPYIKNINEILISHKGAQPIEQFEQLSGKSVVVVANSSYVINLQRINLALGGLGLEPLEIIQANEVLEAEDILEMVNAGLFDYSVTDNHIAKLYQKAFPNLVLYDNFILQHDSQIAWAINKNLPELEKSLNNFIEQYARPGRFLGNSVYRKYFENPFWIQHPLDFTALDKTPCLQYYFEKYAQFYDFDWFRIAALAYQESKFNQKMISHRGAYGIMQIKPTTARSKNVQIKDIKTNMENNIHAGVRYLAFLRDHYFDKPEYSDEDKINFALAAYNAGPGRIRELQRHAKAKGLNPNKWFYNVEVIARNEIGHETVNYVTVIQKTTQALKLATKLAQEKHRQKELHFQQAENALKDSENLMDSDSMLPSQETPSTQAAPSASEKKANPSAPLAPSLNTPKMPNSI